MLDEIRAILQSDGMPTEKISRIQSYTDSFVSRKTAANMVLRLINKPKFSPEYWDREKLEKYLSQFPKSETDGLKTNQEMAAFLIKNRSVLRYMEGGYAQEYRSKSMQRNASYGVNERRSKFAEDLEVLGLTNGSEEVFYQITPLPEVGEKIIYVEGNTKRTGIVTGQRNFYQVWIEGGKVINRNQIQK